MSLCIEVMFNSIKLQHCCPQIKFHSQDCPNNFKNSNPQTHTNMHNILSSRSQQCCIQPCIKEPIMRRILHRSVLYTWKTFKGENFREFRIFKTWNISLQVRLSYQRTVFIINHSSKSLRETSLAYPMFNTRG